MTAFDPQQTPTDDSPPADAPPPPGPHAARAGSYYRNVRYVIFALILGLGLYFLYDGFVGYPAENAEYDRVQAELADATAYGETDRKIELAEELRGLDNHSDEDIFLQKLLGFLLPPVAILLLARWLRISRGEIRLDEDDTLHAPGHPPIPADRITAIDDGRWDRKGISHVAYDLADGRAGSVKLDDFVYDRGPVDRIHDRLVHLKTRGV